MGTKKPSGLKVTRDKNKFKMSWKITEKEYASQKAEYVIITPSTNTKKLNWNKISGVDKKTTSKKITVTESKYYPNSKKPKIKEIRFRVRGKKGNDTSGWTTETFDVKAPAAPTISPSLVADNKTNFAWNSNADDTDKKWYSNFKWQTVRLTNSNISDGTKIAERLWGGGQTLTTKSGTITSLTEDPNSSGWMNGTSYTRWVRGRCFGPQGGSTKDKKDWVYAKHVYARPKPPKSRGGAKATRTSSGGVDCTFYWITVKSVAFPVDSVKVQYLYATPLASLVPPTENVNWQDVPTGDNLIPDKTGNDSLSFHLDSQPGLDQCLWFRAVAKHDDAEEPSAAQRAPICGNLKTPTGLRIDPDQSTHTISVTANNTSDVPGTFLAVKFTSPSFPQGVDVGVMEGHGEMTQNIVCPYWKPTDEIKISVRAVYGTHPYSTSPSLPSLKYYKIQARMSSVEISEGGNVPVPPTNVTAEPTETPGTVRVSWTWAWNKASAAEISWADHEDAWESTEEPSTYTVKSIHNSAWNIAGLETGVDWYFRVRLIASDGDSEVFGPYANAYPWPVPLKSAPSIPSLTLSDHIITKTGTATAAWGYVSNDGTLQSKAEIADVTTVNNAPYYETILTVDTAQHAIIDATAEYAKNWVTGEARSLALRVWSGSGRPSEWSDPVSLTIAEPLSISIDSITPTESFGEINWVIDDDTQETELQLSLQALPIELTINGAGESGTTTLAIERVGPYPLIQPDDTMLDGFDGETVFLKEVDGGQNVIEVGVDDLIGRLDDGATYRFVATVSDSLGQSETIRYPEEGGFYVHWNHQAVAPEGTVTIDEEQAIAVITPQLPEDATPLQGDVCDIYRLSADRPQLVYYGATFGTSYVDPYPTIGELGGYRLVYRTVYNDWIDEDNVLAYVDIYNGFDSLYNIIDFGTDRAYLIWNVDLSSSWKKDFKETQYLGGSVQGDWNPAVSRTGSISGVVVKATDQETIQAMRRLADHAGVCHVRTVDGSSFNADVQVTESRGHEPSDLTVNFSLSFTRVDPEGQEGMPYSEWVVEETEEEEQQEG